MDTPLEIAWQLHQAGRGAVRPPLERGSPVRWQHSETAFAELLAQRPIDGTVNEVLILRSLLSLSCGDLPCFFPPRTG